jgi:signal recognition particle subunit SRP54
VLLTGLQGSGKTTTAAKLGRWLARRGRHPLLVSTVVQRPAARDQLRVLGAQAGITVHHPEGELGPRALLASALAEACALGYDPVLVDTAGRLHVDTALMAELKQLAADARAAEVLYVADAMTGQDALRSAEAFQREVGITGIVLTKLDGDARGGAALSAAAVTGCPVKFAGTGEKLDDLEPFEPQRMVSRILGLGDVLSLIERVEHNVDREAASELARKLRRSEFTLDDFRAQMTQLRKLGPLEQVLSLLPGAGGLAGADLGDGERQLRRAAAIIDSMTPLERREPSIIGGTRRRRIARGSGTSVEEVNRLLRQFAQARKMMKTMGGEGLKQLAARFAQLR